MEFFGIYYQTPMYVAFGCFFIDEPERSKKNIFGDLDEVSSFGFGSLDVCLLIAYVKNEQFCQKCDPQRGGYFKGPVHKENLIPRVGLRGPWDPQ